MLSKSRSFTNAKKELINQATKSVYMQYYKNAQFNIWFNYQLDIVNKIAKPVFLYGCEMLCFCNLDIIKQ